MTAESAIERYQFTCTHCGARWMSDYHVRYVTDGDGDTTSSFQRNGFLCESPDAADLRCDACQDGPVHVVLLARYLVPVTDEHT